MKQLFIRIILTGIIAFLLAACAGKPPVRQTGKAWFDEGMALFEKEKYTKAAERFEQAIRNAESPDVAGAAQWYLGESYYLKKKYEEAIPAFTLFIDLYPNSNLRPLALERLAKSYEEQVFAVGRDQTNTEQAIEYYRMLMREFPEAGLKMQASEKIDALRERLGAQEVYIGRFYFRIKEPNAAVLRLEYAIERFPDTDAADEAAFLLAEHFASLDAPTEAEISRARELYRSLVASRPNSDYVKKLDDIFTEAGIATGV